MARNKSTAQTPAVRHLRYELTNSETPGTETSHYIDLAKDLSAINRRLMRQGRSYHVKRVTVISSNTVVPPEATAGRVSLSVAPNSWTARGAWQRGLKTFNLMNKEATHNLTNNIAGKWADFKIYLSDAHYAVTKLVPKDNGGNDVTYGEWVYSNYISPDGQPAHDEMRIHLMGNHNGVIGQWSSVGLIRSFGNTRATVSAAPLVPGEASDDPLLNVFDYGTTVDEVIDQLEFDNDYPPYSQEDYAGGATNMPKPLVVADATIYDGQANMAGFEALCGLIEVESSSPIGNDVYSVLVELAPGKYRGIKADVI
jgi:hypothetical protein